MTSTTTYLVDLDTLSMVLADDEEYDAREAIDVIAVAVEAELERRCLDGDVVREYRLTGRSSHDDDVDVWNAVLVDGADALRVDILG